MVACTERGVRRDRAAEELPRVQEVEGRVRVGEAVALPEQRQVLLRERSGVRKKIAGPIKIILIS